MKTPRQSFGTSITKLLKVEGGYVNHESDRGGETNFGITKKVAVKNGYTGEMKDMPESFAIGVYKDSYWDAQKLDKISGVCPNIAEKMFDIGVNMGIKTSQKFLQQSLNIMTNTNQISCDGIVGSRTIQKMEMVCKTLSNRRTLLKILNAYQAMRYISICEKDEGQKVFIKGWFTRISFKD